MTQAISGSTARLHARIAGLLYLIVILGGGFAFYVGSTIIVSGDAAAAAAKLLAAEQLFRMAFAANIIAAAAYLAVIAILYELMRPVSRTLSLVAAVLGLAGCATIIGSVHQLGALAFLGDAGYLSAFEAAQRQALARVSLRLNGIGGEIGLVFFGFYIFSLGWLIIRSSFLPKLIGALLIIGSLSYLSVTFADFLAPALRLPAYALAPAFIGELALCIWLTAVGVNPAKWEDQARAA